MKLLGIIAGLFLFGSLFFSTNLALASPLVFLGEDIGPVSVGDLPTSIPNSIAAQNQFLSNLSGYSVEGFESFAPLTNFFTETDLRLFNGTTAEASVSGGLARDDLDRGRFPIEGSNYFHDRGYTRRLTFNSPIAAFGFFLIDYGEMDNNPLGCNRRWSASHR